MREGRGALAGGCDRRGRPGAQGKAAKNSHGASAGPGGGVGRRRGAAAAAAGRRGRGVAHRVVERGASEGVGEPTGLERVRIAELPPQRRRRAAPRRVVQRRHVRRRVRRRAARLRVARERVRACAAQQSQRLAAALPRGELRCAASAAAARTRVGACVERRAHHRRVARLGAATQQRRQRRGRQLRRRGAAPHQPRGEARVPALRGVAQRTAPRLVDLVELPVRATRGVGEAGRKGRAWERGRCGVHL